MCCIVFDDVLCVNIVSRLPVSCVCSFSWLMFPGSKRDDDFDAELISEKQVIRVSKRLVMNDAFWLSIFSLFSRAH